MRLSFAASLVLLLSQSLPAAEAKRPNVLFILADDLATRLGCYGDPLVQSPNIDRLAARGVRFDKAYCQYPLCNPSRASFLTGLRPDTVGIYNNSTHFRENRPDVQTVGQTFQQAGYHVARVGKLYHYMVPDQIGTDGLDDEPSWDERFNPKGQDVEEDRPLVVGLFAEEGAKQSTLKRDISLSDTAGRLSWLASDGPDEAHTDGKIAAKAVELLEASQKKDEPFFLAVGFFRPHTPYVAPKRYFDLYPLEKILLPTVPANYRQTVPAIALRDRPEELAMTDEQRKLAIQAYHASTTFVDAQVGKVLDALDRLKLAEKTIVVFNSDHGYQLYEHGLWQKTCIFDVAARVPLIIAAPGGAKGAVSPRTVELVDLHATLADLAGVPAPKTDGVSLRPLVLDPAAVWSRPAYSQVTHTGLPPGKKKKGVSPVMGYSVRTERYRFTQWAEQGDELYDHDRDPQELHNLASDPAHAATVEQMRKLLPKRP